MSLWISLCFFDHKNLPFFSLFLQLGWKILSATVPFYSLSVLLPCCNQIVTKYEFLSEYSLQLLLKNFMTQSLWKTLVISVEGKQRCLILRITRGVVLVRLCIVPSFLFSPKRYQKGLNYHITRKRSDPKNDVFFSREFSGLFFFTITWNTQNGSPIEKTMVDLDNFNDVDVRNLKEELRSW